jgi:hypothetical protein
VSLRDNGGHSPLISLPALAGYGKAEIEQEFHTFTLASGVPEAQRKIRLTAPRANSHSGAESQLQRAAEEHATAQMSFLEELT